MRIREALQTQFGQVNNADGYRQARAYVRERMDKLLEELQDEGFVDESGMLTTGTKPFNVFARIAGGAMPLPPNMVEENRCLQERGYDTIFLVTSNRPDADAEWANSSDEWLGKASMSERHRFLTTRNLSWRWFNALIFGLGSNEQLAEAVRHVEQMIEAGRHYTQRTGYTGNVGFFFHTYGLSSVNSLHMHMLDLDHVGPTYRHLQHKNLPAEAVLQVLREELAAVTGVPGGSVLREEEATTSRDTCTMYCSLL